MWGQDTERPVSGHRRSSSDAKVELAATSDADAQPIASPKTLRKAASTTFQAFSNSLRSKAQTFYATPNRAEGGPSGSPEPQTPRKTGHVSALLSSVRGRGSRRTQSALRDTAEPLDGPETPTKVEHSSHEHSSLDFGHDHSPIEYTPIDDEPPRISTEIPRSTLEDSMNDHHGDGVTTPAVTPTKSGLSTKHSQPTTSPGALHCERKQLWPSPHMRLRGMALVEQASPKVAQAEATPQGLSRLSPSRSRSAAIDPAIAQSGDEDSVSDQDRAEELSISMLQSAAKGSHVFECDRKSSEDFTGTFWPAGKVLKSSKRSSTEETSAEAGMGPRDPWDKAQADRRRRHAALQSMYTASGEDSDRENLPINSRTLLNEPDAPKGLSREPDQLAQSSAISPLLPPTQDTYIEEHLKAAYEGSPESSVNTMTKKVKVVPSISSLHAKSSDTERPSSPHSVSSLHAECGDTERPSSPSSGSNPAQDSSHDEFTTNKALRQKINEPVASPANPWRMLNNEIGQDSSKPYDADESDPSDSSSDIVRKTESEFRRATVKSIEGFTSSVGKYARYTSTPTPSSPSNSPPREFGKVYVKYYESNGRSGSPSDPEWRVAHQARVDAYITAQSRKYMAYCDQEVSDWPPGQQPRTADGKIDRRMLSRNRANYEALCQFIYRCEQESADEADAEDLAADDCDHTPGNRNNRLRHMDINMTEA
ncbi:MAG: hypothetical protein L6R38_009023 [Xanthoria sp. 2 TBL-2021]|nr:MAG: hypothetical protein L6R38_009023 [Xanthoria sp. 2 TBL-2021]